MMQRRNSYNDAQVLRWKILGTNHLACVCFFSYLQSINQSILFQALGP